MTAMIINTEEQYRKAVREYLELVQFPEGTMEHDEAIVLSEALDNYEINELKKDLAE